MNKMSYLVISFISLSLLISGCTVSGGFNKPSNTNRAGYSAILHPAIGECDAINSKLSVDEAASRIKRQFHFMTTDEMESSPNGDLLLSSSDYGWSSTPGTHYMMKQGISQGRGGFIQAEVSKNGSGSIIDIKTGVHVIQGDSLERAKKDANALADAFRKRIVATLGK